MIAFNVRCEEVLVSRDAPPSVPTLTIVPKETRFDKPLSAAEWRNQDDANGLAIGTLVRRNVGVRHLEECGDGCQGGGGSYGYQPPGAYMTFSRLFDLHEPWTKGNPEIEVHVHGPPSGGNSNYGADLSCSGEHALGERSFDQNGSWWNGDVLIWTGAQETTFATEFPNGYHILFWEDDDTPCVIKTDAPVVRQTIAAIAGAGIGIAFKFITTGPVAAGFALGTWLAGDVLSAEWVTTNDDFVGTLAFPAPGDIFPYNDANYWIRDSNGVTGRANFIFR